MRLRELQFTLYGLALIILTSSGCSEHAGSKISVGHQFPVMEWEDLTGNSTNLNNNKIKLVQFWATWCSVCRKTDPQLVELMNQFDADKFEVVRIALNNDRYSVLEYLIDHPNQFLNLLTPEQALSHYQGLAVPYTVLVDQNGIVVLTKLGMFEFSLVVEKINKLIATS